MTFGNRLYGNMIFGIEQDRNIWFPALLDNLTKKKIVKILTFNVGFKSRKDRDEYFKKPENNENVDLIMLSAYGWKIKFKNDHNWYSLANRKHKLI